MKKQQVNKFRVEYTDRPQHWVTREFRNLRKAEKFACMKTNDGCFCMIYQGNVYYAHTTPAGINQPAEFNLIH